MLYVAVLILSGVILLGGCATSAQRRAAEKEAEVDQICSLPPAEREEALKKMKEQSGMVIFCGRAESTEPQH